VRLAIAAQSASFLHPKEARESQWTHQNSKSTPNAFLKQKQNLKPTPTMPKIYKKRQ
jgi:hypothetical protein